MIYLTASQAIDRVALPVINPAEAAFLDKTTVSITCATEGATIEYSLDGGKTWNPYTGAFDATASGEILARATADDMLPSHEAKASVVREYLSGDVTITVDEQEALTVITINYISGGSGNLLLARRSRRESLQRTADAHQRHAGRHQRTDQGLRPRERQAPRSGVSQGLPDQVQARSDGH